MISSTTVGDDGLSGEDVAPGDGAVEVHGGEPGAEVFALMVGSAEGGEVAGHGPATAEGVGVVVRDEVVEVAGFGGYGAVGVAAA